MISIIQFTSILILLPNTVLSNEIIGYKMDSYSEDNYINIWPKSNINYDTGKKMLNLSANTDQLKVFCCWTKKSKQPISHPPP